MANKDVRKEEKKLPAEQKKVVADKPLDKEKKKQESRKWHASPPSKMKCSCKSEFQDKRYGQGVRLHTIQKDGKSCTVCGNKKM